MHGVRVVDREAGPHEAVHVVDLAAPDVGGAEVVDHDLDAILVDGDVLGPAHVVECHAVLHPRAAAAAYEDTERELRGSLFREELLEAGLRGGGGGGDSFFGHNRGGTTAPAPPPPWGGGMCPRPPPPPRGGRRRPKPPR